MGEHGRDCLRIARETEFTKLIPIDFVVVVVVGSVSGGALLMKMLG